ncbi:hypothetical protein D3C78_848040 [compost metagenome]
MQGGVDAGQGDVAAHGVLGIGVGLGGGLGGGEHDAGVRAWVDDQLGLDAVVDDAGGLDADLVGHRPHALGIQRGGDRGEQGLVGRAVAAAGEDVDGDDAGGRADRADVEHVRIGAQAVEHVGHLAAGGGVALGGQCDAATEVCVGLVDRCARRHGAAVAGIDQ